MNGAKIRRKKKDRVREDMKKHVYFFFFWNLLLSLHKRTTNTI